MSIEIRNLSVLEALLTKNYHTTLIDIILELIAAIGEVVITEGWREGGGVHSTEPCRGIDLRSWVYTPEQQIRIVDSVNSTWIYDPKRPEMKCCILHDVGKGVHIHLQCCDRTRRRI